MDSEQDSESDLFYTDEYEDNKRVTFDKVEDGVKKHIHFAGNIVLTRIVVKLFLNTANMLLALCWGTVYSSDITENYILFVGE